MSDRPTVDRLSRLLRQADPLTEDPGPSPQETAEMRRAILAAVPEKGQGFWPQLSPTVSVVVLLALALGASWWPTVSNESSRAPAPEVEIPVTVQSTRAEAGISESGNSLETRKIQFETPGGTLVVWVLDPNFPS